MPERVAVPAWPVDTPSTKRRGIPSRLQSLTLEASRLAATELHEQAAPEACRLTAYEEKPLAEQNAQQPPLEMVMFET